MKTDQSDTSIGSEFPSSSAERCAAFDGSKSRPFTVAFSADYHKRQGAVRRRVRNFAEPRKPVGKELKTPGKPGSLTEHKRHYRTLWGG